MLHITCVEIPSTRLVHYNISCTADKADASNITKQHSKTMGMLTFKSAAQGRSEEASDEKHAELARTA